MALTLSFSAGPQTDEKQALADLQSLMSRSVKPSDFELQSIEKKYRATRATALARFLRGYQRYLKREYAAAAEILDDPIISAQTHLGDYALFYAGSSLLQANRPQEAEKLFARLWQSYPDSIYARLSLMQAAESARARGDLRLAVATVQPLANSDDIPALLLQASCYEKLGERRKAIELYERVHFDLPPTKESLLARTRLVELGVAVDDLSLFPYERALKRADRLYRTGAYHEAVKAYRALVKHFPRADEDDLVNLRLGVSLYQSGPTRDAISPLRKVGDENPDVKSEALYYLAECYKRMGHVTEFLSTNKQVVEKYPKSVWAAHALYSRAHYYLKANEIREAVEAFKQLLALQPQFEFAPEASWNIGWIAYRRGDKEQAARLLIEHVATYPQSPYLIQAAYWAARAEESLGRLDRALALYNRVIESYRYVYYGQMASVRIKSVARRSSLVASEKTVTSDSSSDQRPATSDQFSRALANIHPAQRPTETASEKALQHVEKAGELRLIKLDDLALGELEAASQEAPTSPRVRLETARIYRDKGDHLAALNALRQAHPDYLAYQGDEVPEEVFRIFYPLAHWDLIRQHARLHQLDPSLLAGLIRQESGFNVRARSVANARGLMQLIPSTGRRVARRSGIRRIRPEQLYDPATNIRLGTAYLADMIKRFKRVEYALAAYNAGPMRVTRWMRDLAASDMDEWIESLPITQTRLYVQAVLRSAAHYRRIYGEKATIQPLRPQGTKQGR